MPKTTIEVADHCPCPRGLLPSGGNFAAKLHVILVPCAHSAQTGVQGHCPCLPEVFSVDGNLIQGIIMVVLLVMSAFFSATETSFSALNGTQLKNMAEKGNKRATRRLR